MKEYRQVPLAGFDSISTLKETLLSKEVNPDTNVNSYALSPENFLDTIENRIDSVEFRYTPGFHGYICLNRDKYDHLGRIKVDLTMTNDTPHERQAKTLVHEMIHVDREEEISKGQIVFFSDSFRAEEEELVSQAAKEFYMSHNSLAKLALYHVWQRRETKP